jgi:hypothetical protein
MPPLRSTLIFMAWVLGFPAAWPPDRGGQAFN